MPPCRASKKIHPRPSRIARTRSPAQRLELFERGIGIGAPHFGSGLVGGEHPVDSSAALVSLRLPDVDLGDEPVAAFDAAIETLAFEHADLDLNHVEPAGVLGRVVELKPPEHAPRFGRWECGVESGSGVGGEVVEDDADELGLWEVDIDELAHADGEVVSGATTSDLDPAPRAMCVKEDKEIDGAVAAILVIEAFGPSRRRRDWLTRFADELAGAFVEADHRPLRVRLLGIEVEHILHAGDVLGVDLGDAPQVLLPGLEMVLGQASTDGEDAVQRLRRLEKQLALIVPEWSMAPVVEAYQAMRGASFLVAVTFAAEIGDVRRFDTPGQLMSFLGLVPAERSTGDTIRRNGLILAGNRRARRALIEAAWTYRYPARVSETLRARLEALPKPVREIARKAQVRLCARYRRLSATGKKLPVVVAAIAREMAAFLWAIGREVAPA